MKDFQYCLISRDHHSTHSLKNESDPQVLSFGIFYDGFKTAQGNNVPSGGNKFALGGRLFVGGRLFFRGHDLLKRPFKDDFGRR